MSAYTFQEIEFKISVKEGHYYYEQKVSPAYLICGTGISWASLVVHRLPGKFRTERWFVSEHTTGSAIDIPETTSQEAAAESAVSKIKELGEDRFQKVLARTQTRKAKKWKPNRQKGKFPT